MQTFVSKTVILSKIYSCYNKILYKVCNIVDSPGKMLRKRHSYQKKDLELLNRAFEKYRGYITMKETAYLSKKINVDNYHVILNYRI